MTANVELSQLEINSALGIEITKIRVAKKATQTNVAQAIGVSFQQYQKYENGTNRISIGRFVGICRFLGVSPGELLDRYFDVENAVDVTRAETAAEGNLLGYFRQLDPKTQTASMDMFAAIVEAMVEAKAA
jgi:transcriptional regulator with XRE-family HTH domain